jgi:hypothetical protein
MANTISKARGGSGVGIKWAQRFVKRTPALEVKLGRTYECQRKLSENSEVIRGWFTLVKNTVDKYGILPEDIYKFDETGFQMGQISASKVVTATDRLGRPKQVKPTNTEWVTSIQGVCADGSLIPPFIVMKGKEFNQTWFVQGLPSTWTFSVSKNGWTTDKIGLQWIHHFERHTRSKTVGSKRLLVLDNHGSHTTPEFRSFCEDNNIVLLWMPPHSSHLLQPLDVGCFSPLKTAFSKQNQDLIRNHIFHIRKVDFLATFYTAFQASFTQENIKAGFRGSGLHPFDPEAVLSQLDPVLESLSPPSSQESWCTLLGLRHLEGHTGNDIVDALIPVIKLFDVGNKLGAFQMDNATSNDTAMSALAARIPGINSKESRLRCFGHVVNLVVKALLYGSKSSTLQQELGAAGSDDDAAFKIWREQGSIGRLYNLVTYILRSDNRQRAFEASQKVDASMFILQFTTRTRPWRAVEQHLRHDQPRS